MNIRNNFSRVGLSLLAVITMGWATVSQAQTALLPTETFQSWPPPNWTCTAFQQYGGWYQSANGYGGTNGSAVCDIWDYSSAPLITPPVDASGYAASDDSVSLDFDFCWQYNGYNSEYQTFYGNGDDGFQVLVNSDQLVLMSTSANQTYSTSNYSYDVDPPTDAGSWKHYHYVIPIADRTSNMTISFQGVPYWGLSNPAIDNVTIKAYIPSQLSLSPKAMNFGPIIIGQSSTICATASSLGPGTLSINGLTLQGDSDFTLVPGFKQAGDSISVGSSSDYCILFTPQAPGLRSAVFTLMTSGRDSGKQQITLTGSGLAASVAYNVNALFRKVTTKVGDTSAARYISITSNGNAPLTINSITFAGLNPDQYYVSRFPANPIPIGVTDSIGISFTPTFDGRPDVQVVINTNAFNNPSDSIRLFGVGILPRLALSPAANTFSNMLNFDSVAIGDSVCKFVTLSNPGTDTLRITRQLKSSGDFDFTFYPLQGSDTSIAPNQTRNFNVCFTPLKNGTRQATYRFYTNISRSFPSGDTSQVVLNITGVGVPIGRLAIKGGTIDSSLIGTKICQNVTVTNVGLSDLTITSDSLTGANAFDFTSDLVAPLVLRAGSSQVVNVCFTPSGRGLRVAQVILTGTSAGRPQTLNVPILGVGLQACANASPLALFTTPTLVGSMDSSTVTVNNCGDVANTYTTTITGPGYTVSPATTAAIAPGATTSFVVHFAPAAMGADPGTLVINGGNGITPQTVALGGVGGAVILSASGDAGQVMKGDCKNFDVTVTNNGNVAWTPSTGMIAGTNSSDFTIISSPATIAANGTGTVTIKFCATVVGQESATLSYPSGTPTPQSGGTIALSGSGVVNGVSSPAVANGYELDQSYPNPASSVADVRFVLPSEAMVRIDLMDATGATIKTVVNQRMSGGEHAATIDAHTLASGTYFYVLTSNGVRLVKQMVLVK